MPTQATADFLAAHVPAGGSILEVGSGAGHVALELARRGFRVTGIEPDADAVKQAQDGGAPVRHGSWPGVDTPDVDAIAFTRSLHHLHDLDGAVQRAREVLGPDGLILVEDFDFGGANERTIRWLVAVLRSPPAAELLRVVPDEFATTLLRSSDPVAAWSAGHDHDLHSADAMIAAIGREFEVGHVRPAPYLYRYLVPVLPNTEAATALVRDVLAEEVSLGEEGDLTLIGRRIVASRMP
ncbi:MAG: class I SAM-dependent methyltransferase [Gemmatimonadota bacterium]